MWQCPKCGRTFEKADQNHFCSEARRAISAEHKRYEYSAVIHSAEEDAATRKGGAYVVFPHDIRAEFGKGRVKVHATFDGEPYSGSIVNMGLKNADGSICYIIGIPKAIRQKIGKQPGDTIHVSLRARE